MAVSQRPFDPYQAGAEVYRAYRAGGRPGRAARPTDNPGCGGGFLFRVFADIILCRFRVGFLVVGFCCCCFMKVTIGICCSGCEYCAYRNGN
jgi:hypothetical protein